MKCTFCGKEIDNILVLVTLGLTSKRKRDDLTWERIPNMDISTSEELCEDCFNSFSENLSREMKKERIDNV
jgi:hypothetical protein